MVLKLKVVTLMRPMSKLPQKLLVFYAYICDFMGVPILYLKINIDSSFLTCFII